METFADYFAQFDLKEQTYKEAFQKLSVAVNEASVIIMSALAECEDLFMKAIEEQSAVEHLEDC